MFIPPRNGLNLRVDKLYTRHDRYVKEKNSPPLRHLHPTIDEVQQGAPPKKPPFMTLLGHLPSIIQLYLIGPNRKILAFNPLERITSFILVKLLVQSARYTPQHPWQSRKNDTRRWLNENTIGTLNIKQCTRCRHPLFAERHVFFAAAKRPFRLLLENPKLLPLLP